MNDDETTISSIKEMMASFVREREWEKYHTPRSLAISIVIEGAELLELFQWHEGKEPSAEDIMSSPEMYASVMDEVADVFLYLVEMCNILDIDLASAVEKKMEKNRKKYPADLYRGRAKIE